MGCVYRNFVFLELINFFFVKLHQLYVWVLLDGLQIVVDNLIVVVNAINAFQQAFQNIVWAVDACRD